MARPLVSVIIPTFNRARFLREAVDSVVGQTVRDLELLIVDDCSTDETAELIRSLSASDERVRGLKTDVNRGCNRARNVGLDRARGAYVAFLDDDDVALPRRLEESLAALQANPGVSCAACNYRFIDASGNERRRTPTEAFECVRVIDDEALFEMLYCEWVWIPTSTLTFRAPVFDRHRYPDINRSDGDTMMLSQMAAHGVSLVKLGSVGTLMRRDNVYPFMSRDKRALMAARRETLHSLREWLRGRGITRFDHLHARAWSNHLIKEAEHFGGVGGLMRCLRAFAADRTNDAAVDFLRRKVTSRLKRSVRAISEGRPAKPSH